MEQLCTPKRLDKILLKCSKQFCFGEKSYENSWKLEEIQWWVALNNKSGIIVIC